MRLQLYALAYNLANFLRCIELPEAMADWSLTSPQLKLIKIGARVVRHARAENERALALGPDNSDVLVLASECLIFAGQLEAAEKQVLRVLRLSPIPAQWYLFMLGEAQYALGRYLATA